MTYNAFLLLDVHTPPSSFCNDDLGNYTEMRYMYEYNLTQTDTKTKVVDQK